MTVLKIALGFVTLLICLAGVMWYGVYLFGPSGRPDHRGATDQMPAAPGSTRISLTPYARRQQRRTVMLGAAAVIGGLVIGRGALESIRTGIPLHTLNGPDVNGWVAMAAVVCIIVMGAAMIGAGLGLIKLRDGPPYR